MAAVSVGRNAGVYKSSSGPESFRPAIVSLIHGNAFGFVMLNGLPLTGCPITLIAPPRPAWSADGRFSGAGSGNWSGRRCGIARSAAGATATVRARIPPRPLRSRIPPPAPQEVNGFYWTDWPADVVIKAPSRLVVDRQGGGGHSPARYPFPTLGVTGSTSANARCGAGLRRNRPASADPPRPTAAAGPDPAGRRPAPAAA